ncbi:MAG: TonB family protein [Bacteroidetes bacterium]|nr:TonB family protein [Bacteroidota bacterium]
MRRILLLLFLFPALSPLLAQDKGDHARSSKKYREKFSYAKEGPERVLRTWYHYVVSATDQGTYLLRVFYPETGQLTLRATYSDKATLDRTGPSMEWYDSGALKSEGGYVHNKREGTWRLFAPTSTGWEGGNYHLGLKEGTWETKGPSGERSMVRTYVHDVLHGPFVLYDSLGADTGYYEQGRLVMAPKRYGAWDMPAFGDCPPGGSLGELDACSGRAVLGFLAGSARYPADAVRLDVTGQALIAFTVDPEGRVIDVEVLSGVCRSIEAECLRVMALFPRWTPGRKDGRAVKCRFTQPFRFKLQ